LGENSFLVVATSRPETIFADRALFLNPEDNRYKKFHNKSAINPITEEIIPILLDKNVKMDFGSGVLKCTPAHDVSDYELGLRYNLEVKSCCDENGVLNEISGK
jgi:valyl-tRNA synthetase